MNVRILTGSLLSAFFITANAQSVSSFPSKPMTIVVPVAAGGTVDRIARIIGEGMSKELGQPVIVENRAGAAGTIGTRAVANAPADGYTLLAIANTFVSVPEFVENAGYNPIKDFTPVTQTASIPMVLVTEPSTKPRTVQELIEYAKSAKEPISLGSSGLGSTGYIAAELFKRAVGVDVLNVYYKGNSQALNDVIGGHLFGMFDQVSTAASNVKAGRINAIAVTTLTRSPSLPDVPTMDEAGLKGFLDETFNAIMAPAGTPPAVVDKLHAAIKKTMLDPAMKNTLAEQGIEVKISSTPAEFGRYLESLNKSYKDIASSAPKAKP